MTKPPNLQFQQRILRFHLPCGELPPLACFGVTPAGVVCLDCLARQTHSRLSGLAEALHDKPASISGIFTPLVSVIPGVRKNLTVEKTDANYQPHPGA